MDSVAAAVPANSEERIFHMEAGQVIHLMTEGFEAMLFKEGSNAETVPVSQLKKMTVCWSLETWQHMSSSSEKMV
jgi:hypothetical protein